MTAEQAGGNLTRKKKTAAFSNTPPLFRTVLPTVGVGFCMLFFLIRPEVGRASVLEGLRLAGLGVLPAVFPFLVLSDLLISSGGLPAFAVRFAESLFRLPQAGGTAILLGWLCGFPIGARCARNALAAGKMTREQAERTVRIASVPSPAFLIGAVGDGMLGDRGIGIFLYLAALVSASLVGILDARRSPRQYPPESEQIRSAPSRTFALLLTESVRGAAIASLNLCAYVVFFSALRGAIGALLGRFGSLPVAIASGILELSGGISAACSLTIPLPAVALCGAAAGWCGLAVQFQIASVMEGSGFRFGRFLISKALHSGICMILTLLWIRAAF